jgi:hypothetical protein
MAAKLLVFLIFLLAIGSAYAYDLEDYPEPFVLGGDFRARIVVGASSPAGDTLAATTIATSLQQLVPSEKLTALLDIEVINPFAENLILVGDCQNTLIAEVKGQSECYQNFAAGTGVVEFFYYDDINVLIIGGKDTDGRRKAAAALAKYKSMDFEGMEAEITGTLSFPRIGASSSDVVIEENEDVVVTTTAEPQESSATCINDSACNYNEFCSQFGCLELECPEGFTAVNHTCDRQVKEPVKILDEVTPDIAVPSAAAPHNINIIQRFINWIKSLFS